MRKRRSSSSSVDTINYSILRFVVLLLFISLSFRRTPLVTKKTILTTSDQQPTIHSSSSSSSLSGGEIMEDAELLDWDRLDINPQFPCGHYKCFFELLPSRTEGYIVALNGTQQSMDMDQGWNLTQHAVRGGGKDATLFRHFLLGPSMDVPIRNNSNSKLLFTKRMDQLANSTTNHKWLKRIGQFKEEANRTQKLVVQRVKKAPSPSLLVFCNDDKRHETQKAIRNFKVHNKNKFVSTLYEKEIPSLVKSFEKVPLLWRDFQIYIDNRGQIHHLDLDRAFAAHGHLMDQQYKQDCLSFLRCTIHQVVSVDGGGDDEGDDGYVQHHHQGQILDDYSIMNCTDYTQHRE